MSLTRSEIIESVKMLTVAELVALTKELQETFGVTANRAPAPIDTPAPVEPVVEEPTTFNVMLTSFGEKKINVIKAMREVTGLGLKESKDLVECVPSPIKENVTKVDAEALKLKFEAEGATIEIRAVV